MRNNEFLALIALEEEDAEEGEEERAAYAMMEMERGMGGGGYGMRDDDDGEDGFGPDDVLGLESTSPPQPPSAPTMPIAPQLTLAQMHGAHLTHPLRMLPGAMHGYPSFDAPGFDPSDAEKLAAWNSHLYSALQWQAAQAQAQAHAQALFTPPGSAHGAAPPFPAAALFQQQQRNMLSGFAPASLEDESSSASDQASHRGSPASAHAGTQTGFDELAAAAAYQAHQTRAGRSASMSSFGAPPMRKHPSQNHVPQVGGVGGPFAPMGLLI